MSNVSRRGFFAGAAALPLATHSISAGAGLVLGGVPAETVIVTTRSVLTMDPQQPVADAVATRGDRILAVGSTSDIEQLTGPNTSKIDARGHTVTPGFIDAHSHPLDANPARGVNVNLSSIAEVQRALKERAATKPKNHWVVGVMYDDTKFVEGRPLTRRDIDAVVPDRPVYVGHRGGHTAVVNCRAFELAGITMDTPDPEGGRIFRENGQFTGKVQRLRRRKDEKHVCASQFSRCRHSGSARIRLCARAIRANDGDPEHRDPQGHAGQGLGAESADFCVRGDANLYDARGVRIV